MELSESHAGGVHGSRAGEMLAQEFAREQVTALRHAVARQAQAAGLRDDALDDFVTAVHELVINAVRHGGGRGLLRLRRDDDTLICDVIDHGGGFADGVPLPAGPPAANVTGGRGIMLARLLTDTLLISDTPAGVTATVTFCLTAAEPPVTVADRGSSRPQTG
ncbi:ATP-binding protein [Paractinoplanes maris]|uniref:ATP-binding protein n=1 Tax=Paractinoplanes maris TaxID=1734446 RepID=UPI002020E5D7|nr:ATP-binding protein [Actinoplanes maris]